MEGGPYAHVRHPGYAAGLLIGPGIAFAFGSYVALIPAAIGTAALVVRTYLEDETLAKELPGDADYRMRTVARLIPRVW